MLIGRKHIKRLEVVKDDVSVRTRINANMVGMKKMAKRDADQNHGYMIIWTIGRMRTIYSLNVKIIVKAVEKS
jgi:hypothetical protein